MIYDEDPLRRRPREIDGHVKTTGGVCLDDAKYGQMAFWTQENRKIRPSVGYGENTIPLAVRRWYNLLEFGCYLGNVGSKTMEE